jgi:hypothetical protein
VSGVLLDGFLVHAFSHHTAQLEVRKALPGHLDRFASFWITSRVGFILFHFEAAKATNLNPPTFGCSLVVLLWAISKKIILLLIGMKRFALERD